MGFALDFSPVFDAFGSLMLGLWLSVRLAGLSMAAGTAIAVVLAAAKLNGGRLVRILIDAYVELVRNTPLLVQAFFVFFALPVIGLRLRPDAAAFVTLVLNAAAYMTEIIRAGIQSIPRGQVEAGTALGLRPLQVLRLVVLRPALRAVFPALAAQFNIVLLGSSVMSAISADELTHEAEYINSLTFRSFETYSVVGVIYFVTAWLFSVLFGAARRRLFTYPDVQ